MAEFIKSPNYWAGRSKKITRIVIHWWDDPAKKPSISGVIATFQNPAREASAHYVVSDTRIVQMVKEQDTAWHAGQANPFSIGIEVDPRTPGKTYQTLGALVRDIRKRHGNLPLEPHNKYMATRCPGTIDFKKIEQYASGTTTKKEDEMPSDSEIKKTYGVIRGKAPSASELKHHSGKSTWASLIFGFEGEMNRHRDRDAQTAATLSTVQKDLDKANKAITSLSTRPTKEEMQKALDEAEKRVKDAQAACEVQEEASQRESVESWLTKLIQFVRSIWTK